ncbi:hypothetical protein [Gordonia hirsuta]|uniref:hypothetical protein n=1 Tax=Gordonia hirsuta TaxID=53427 RepID=UPI00034737BC
MPAGWQLWIPETTAPPAATVPPYARTAPTGRRTGTLTGILRHRVWASVTTVVTALAVIVALFAWSRPGAGPTGRVQLAAATLGPVIELTGERGGPGAGPPQSQEVGAVPIDVTLKNTGDQPVRVTSINVDLLQGDRIRQCHAAGAGPGRITASYSVRLPIGPDYQLKLGPVTAPAEFTVAPQQTDRMVITVGPESQSHLFVDLIAFRINLGLDDGSRVELPSVAAATAVETAKNYTEGAQKLGPEFFQHLGVTCFKEMGELFDNAFAATDLQTEPLKELRTIYAKIVERF